MLMTGVSTFLDAVRLSGLLTPAQLLRIQGESKIAEDPNAVAAQLVDDGWLTHWQAQQLWAGRRPLRLGRVKLLDFLGKGSMATVFKAQHPLLGLIALKVLSPNRRDQRTAVSLFLREGRIASALDHPNLVGVYGVEPLDGTFAMPMKYVDGIDLREWIHCAGHIPIGWSCEFIRQSALGVQYLSEQGLVHRDLKPSNLLVTHDWASGNPVVKILDFGVSWFEGGRHEDEPLLRDQIVGTPGYLAPEQIERSTEIDSRADIFGLGCVLFELLSGHNPFGGQTIEERIDAPLTRTVSSLCHQRLEVPVELDLIVSKMVARNPQDRFRNAAEVATSLAPFCTTDWCGLPPPGSARGGRGLSKRFEPILLLDEPNEIICHGTTLPSMEIGDCKLESSPHA